MSKIFGDGIGLQELWIPDGVFCLITSEPQMQLLTLLRSCASAAAVSTPVSALLFLFPCFLTLCSPLGSTDPFSSEVSESLGFFPQAGQPGFMEVYLWESIVDRCVLGSGGLHLSQTLSWLSKHDCTMKSIRNKLKHGSTKYWQGYEVMRSLRLSWDTNSSLCWKIVWLLLK